MAQHLTLDGDHFVFSDEAVEALNVPKRMLAWKYILTIGLRSPEMLESALPDSSELGLWEILVVLDRVRDCEALLPNVIIPEGELGEISTRRLNDIREMVTREAGRRGISIRSDEPMPRPEEWH